jgi:hypothetical protein
MIKPGALENNGRLKVGQRRTGQTKAGAARSRRNMAEFLGHDDSPGRKDCAPGLDATAPTKNNDQCDGRHDTGQALATGRDRYRKKLPPRSLVWFVFQNSPAPGKAPFNTGATT